MFPVRVLCRPALPGTNRPARLVLDNDCTHKVAAALGPLGGPGHGGLVEPPAVEGGVGEGVQGRPGVVDVAEQKIRLESKTSFLLLALLEHKL